MKLRREAVASRQIIVSRMGGFQYGCLRSPLLSAERKGSKIHRGLSASGTTARPTSAVLANARIQRGRDEVRGDYISYNAITEFFQVIGGGKTAATPGNPQGRVRAVIQPKPKAAAQPGAASSVELAPSDTLQPAPR